MSTFHGKQQKGAMREHKRRRYAAAVGRQLLMCDRGRTRQESRLIPGTFTYPVPVEELLRPGDTEKSYDWRSWAVES